MMMRSPLWILNDIVGIILMAMLGFVLLYKPEPPIKKTLTPAHQAPAPKKDTSLIDIKRIYNNDLFNTYSPAVVPTSDLTPQEIPFPTPPLLAPVQQPTPANPQILPPLGVTLKGILFSNNEKDTLAVISDNKTKQESLYKVGDLVEDAEIIRIAKNQVIFIRTNGQQEVIFITLAEAQKDPHFAPPPSWSDIIKKNSETSFAVDREQFIAAVPTVADFIDMLEVTTAFTKGISVGCNIGPISSQSFGPWLGFKSGDIVTKVNDISTTNTSDRIKIFELLKTMVPGDTITVALLRNGKPIELSYDLTEPKLDLVPLQNNEELPERKLLERSVGQASTGMDMNKRDKEFMSRYAGPSAMLKRTNIY